MKTRSVALWVAILLVGPLPGHAESQQQSVTLILAKESDTGRSNSDRVTARPNPQLAGIGVPGTELEIRDGERVLPTHVIDRDGKWTLRVGPL